MSSLVSLCTRSPSTGIAQDVPGRDVLLLCAGVLCVTRS